ncbi:hypothetical protein L1049_020884 [Liquidambar formosana]|uniref:Formin-like protein n=1 Tax=Liquidambar formosana TaxID=63359 RepID=A0AAP0SAM1_LIQFO
MGYGTEILHMILIIFMLISLHNTHILIAADASLNAPENFNVHGLQELYFMEDKTDGTVNHIEKVSGEDEKEEKEALILEKFRVLLGLKSLKKGPQSGDSVYGSGSPSPSPTPTIEAEAEAEAPAPAPVLPIHVHTHPPSPPRPSPVPPPHKIHKKDTNKGRVKKIIVAALVSAGVTFILCVLGFIWVCRKFRKHRKRSARTTSTFTTKRGTRGRSKYVNSENSVSKVSFNPGIDLFYLNTLGIDLDQHASSLKQNSEIVNASSNQNSSNCTLHKKEESDPEAIRTEFDNVSSSSTREIMSVHESAESMKYESDGGNSSSCDRIIPVESHSSDDESFHSFCHSHSSNARLSNASSASLGDTSEIFSPNVLQDPPSTLASSVNLPIPPTTPALNLQSSPPKRKILAAPPPPPPPPPPPCVHFPPPHSSSCSTRITARASCSTLPNFSSPRNSDSSSGSNQTPQRDLPSSPGKSDPKPPQTPVGIPPPPPPPFLKGNSNTVKTPPPPPSLIPQFMPMGKDGAPLPKLKPLHWDKVRAAPDCSMVWDKLRSSSFELDEEMIESLFGYNLQGSMKNDEGKSKSPSPSKHVLEPKRLQNITILSKALNATAEQVCDALLQGNGLRLQQLEALVKMVPTKEEEAKLSGYDGDINELGSAEKFVKAMLNIPFAFLRIEAMLYRDTFEDEVVHLRKSFSMLEEACKELRSSRLFLKLLEAVLKTGNRMNVGTIRGGARAFKLDALLKLADVKGTDGKTTLLHFVVQEMIRSEETRESETIVEKINLKRKTVEEREEDNRKTSLDLVSGLSTELCNVKKTATIDLDVLASSVSNLSDGMAKLQHLVQKDLYMEKNSGNFVHSMRSFLNYAQKNLKELQEDEDRVLLHVREIREYFHGNVSKDEANPLRIFVIVRDFLGMLDHVCKELRSLKVPSSPNPLAPFR